MRNPVFFLIAVLFALLPIRTAHAAARSFEHAAGLSPTETVDKTQLEGWIVKVDYKQNNFRILDPRGFERTVFTKPGTIGDYQRGDHVKVSIDRDREWMSQVVKL